jgi:hypothetical protein
MTIKEMEIRLTQTLAKVNVANLIWMLARDHVFRAELDRKVEDRIGRQNRYGNTEEEQAAFDEGWHRANDPTRLLKKSR